MSALTDFWYCVKAASTFIDSRFPCPVLPRIRCELSWFIVSGPSDTTPDVELVGGPLTGAPAEAAGRGPATEAQPR